MSPTTSDRAAYAEFDSALAMILDGLRRRVSPTHDEVQAANVAAFYIRTGGFSDRQLIGLLGVLLSQVVRAEKEVGMRWLFRRSEPAQATMTEVVVTDDEAAGLRERIAAADNHLTRLMAGLRLQHRPTAGVDLGELFDMALDVRNALRPKQQTSAAKPAESASAAVTE